MEFRSEFVQQMTKAMTQYAVVCVPYPYGDIMRETLRIPGHYLVLHGFSTIIVRKPEWTDGSRKLFGFANPPVPRTKSREFIVGYAKTHFPSTNYLYVNRIEHGYEVVSFPFPCHETVGYSSVGDDMTFAHAPSRWVYLALHLGFHVQVSFTRCPEFVDVYMEGVQEIYRKITKSKRHLYFEMDGNTIEMCDPRVY